MANTKTKKGEPETQNVSTLSLRTYNALLTIFCLIGIGLSLYAYTVELKLEKNQNYQPVCDVNPYISCSKAFKSEYGKGFGIFAEDSVLHQPNSLFGIMYYSMLATLVQANTKVAVGATVLLIITSNFASLYFAYVLYFVLFDLCLVCVGIYVVNIINLILIQYKCKTLKCLAQVKPAKNE